MNDNTTNENQTLPLEPNDAVFNEPSTKTIGQYLKENELFDLFLRLKIHVDEKFSIQENEEVPPQ